MQFYLQRPIAHRGLHNNLIPENSMASFKEAMSHGFSIEVDIHLSKDNVPVVFHDEDLERMTGSKGKISQYTLQSLKKLRLKETDQQIPTLKEVLLEVDSHVPLIIEIKCLEHDSVIEKTVCESLKDYEGDFAIQSFNPLTLKWIRSHYPNFVLGLLSTGDLSDTKLNMVKKGLVKYMSFIPFIRPDYVGMDYSSFSLLQYLIVKKLTHGDIIFWTINSEEIYQECKEFCDNIIFEGFLPGEKQ